MATFWYMANSLAYRSAFSRLFIVASGVSLLALFVSCGQTEIVHASRNQLGTIVTITASRVRPAVAEPAIEAAFSVIQNVDEALSSYKPGSELSRLNETGFIENPSELLYDNLKASLSYARLTDGAFDITILPILRLYEDRFGNDRVPTEQEINAELARVDYRRIRMYDDRIELGENQRITFGGIAKGYAVDLAAETLIASGITNGIIEAGGDMRVIGRKSDDRDWHIAIQNPRDPDQYIARLIVPDRAVVTSGDYERFFDADHEYHHIINPKTGRSATELISVTVVARTAFDADAISTAAFVMGPEKGLALIESLDDVEALFITRSRRVIRSSGFERYEVRT